MFGVHSTRGTFGGPERCGAGCPGPDDPRNRGFEPSRVGRTPRPPHPAGSAGDGPHLASRPHGGVGPVPGIQAPRDGGGEARPPQGGGDASPVRQPLRDPAADLVHRKRAGSDGAPERHPRRGKGDQGKAGAPGAGRGDGRGDTAIRRSHTDRLPGGQRRGSRSGSRGDFDPPGSDRCGGHLCGPERTGPERRHRNGGQVGRARWGGRGGPQRDPGPPARNHCSPVLAGRTRTHPRGRLSGCQGRRKPRHRGRIRLPWTTDGFPVPGEMRRARKAAQSDPGVPDRSGPPGPPTAPAR